MALLRPAIQQIMPATAAMRALATQSGQHSKDGGFIEVREYTMKPEGLNDFLSIVTETASLRAKHLPFLGMFATDVGGVLNKVTHFYHFKDFDERDEIRHAAMKDPAWVKMLADTRKHIVHQTSKVMLEAKPVYEALNLPPTREYKSPAADQSQGVVTYEMRTYQLHPGYGSVPKLVQAFSKGLPDKVAADKQGQLVFFGYTDVGMLNHVMELWRYPSAQACIRARQAARTVQPWRETISQITPSVQHFVSEFVRPTSFSPWQ